MGTNHWQIGVWIVGIVGGLITASLGILQAVQNRRQREKELRWKQADSGKQLIDQLFGEQLSYFGAQMLDSWSRTYLVPGAGKIRIEWEDIPKALNIESIGTSDTKSEFIRECCDAFLFCLDRFEHFIQAGLTTFQDVRTPSKYYVELMAEDKGVWISYIEFCKYEHVLQFLNRFPQWVEAQ
jgi:hypothetical protein